MHFRWSRRRYILLWQISLLLLGTSWLWAPLLNPGLSDRLSLISDYETAHQPYAWLLRICDLLAGFIVLALAWVLLQRRQKTMGWLTLIIGLCSIFDSLLPTSCQLTGTICQSNSTPRYIIHGVESVVGGLAFFMATIHDAFKRKKLLSWSVIVLQIAYGLYFLIETVGGVRTHTIYQYAYQVLVIAWLTWYGRDFLFGDSFLPGKLELKMIKRFAAAWAFANGVFAVVISLAHIQLLGRLKGLYFPGDSSWLAQHAVITGVILLYLSRHLLRGERRARQIFLAIIGIETLKYSIITPSFALLALYSFSFVVLFIFRDDFNRGTIPLTWSARLKDLYYMIAGLVLAGGSALVILDRDNQVSRVTRSTFNHFSSLVSRGGLAGHSHMRSVLLAHTVSAFLAAAAASILWILFRPHKIIHRDPPDYARAEALLLQMSDSTEDYFKLWPHDKQYFWSKHSPGFVAYKITGSVAFAMADPISPHRQKMITEFVEWTRGQRLKTCFLPVYPGSLKMYEEAGLQSMQVGASAVIDIKTFLSKTSNDKWWRWQKNRAAKSAYEFARSSPLHPPELLQQLHAISSSWLKVGGHSEYGFALGHHDKNYLNQCQIYYLKDGGGKAIAFTNQIPQFHKSETVTVDLLRYLPELNNAMQFLLYKTIESVATESANYRYFDLGFVPFAKAKGPIMAIARTFGGTRFSARGLEQFKNKFDPHWQPNYMAYDGDLGDLATVALHLEKSMELE